MWVGVKGLVVWGTWFVIIKENDYYYYSVSARKGNNLDKFYVEIY